jgi:hypothetical protein
MTTKALPTNSTAQRQGGGGNAGKTHLEHPQGLVHPIDISVTIHHFGAPITVVASHSQHCAVLADVQQQNLQSKKTRVQDDTIR